MRMPVFPFRVLSYESSARSISMKRRAWVIIGKKNRCESLAPPLGGNRDTRKGRKKARSAFTETKLRDRAIEIAVSAASSAHGMAMMCPVNQNNGDLVENDNARNWIMNG